MKYHWILKISSILAGQYEKPKRSSGMFLTVDSPERISGEWNELDGLG